jgi:hypothetical protein
MSESETPEAEPRPTRTSGGKRHQQYRRVGDTAMCPACGVSMAPEAYRCPRCLIYFCFKCRRRVAQRDPQFQCVNQQCEQYGKLLCSICVVDMPQMGDRTRSELVKTGVTGIFKPAFTNADLVLAFGSVVVALSLLAAVFGAAAGPDGPTTVFTGAVISIILGAALAAYMSSQKVRAPDVPAVYRTVTESVEVGRSKCCIACRQAAQRL